MSRTWGRALVLLLREQPDIAALAAAELKNAQAPRQQGPDPAAKSSVVWGTWECATYVA